MRWWSKKKEKEEDRFWTAFRKRDQCDECGNLEQGEDPSLVSLGFNGVCPECGSENISSVIGRWEISSFYIGMAMAYIITYHKSETKGEQ